METFRHYGLPARMNMDNGSPWGSPSGDSRGLSALSLWLVRLGIQVSFSAPVHPQTNGKDERFHRSLKAEVLNGRTWIDHAHVQQAFDAWRAIYNHRRPHEGIGMAVPGARYRPSPRRFPETLPPIEYGPDDTVCTQQWTGHLPRALHEGLQCAAGTTHRRSSLRRGRRCLRVVLRPPPPRHHRRARRRLDCYPCPGTDVTHLPGLYSTPDARAAWRCTVWLYLIFGYRVIVWNLEQIGWRFAFLHVLQGDDAGVAL